MDNNNLTNPLTESFRSKVFCGIKLVGLLSLVGAPTGGNESVNKTDDYPALTGEAVM